MGIRLSLSLSVGGRCLAGSLAEWVSSFRKYSIDLFFTSCVRVGVGSKVEVLAGKRSRDSCDLEGERGPLESQCEWMIESVCPYFVLLSCYSVVGSKMLGSSRGRRERESWGRERGGRRDSMEEGGWSRHSRERHGGRRSPKQWRDRRSRSPN